MFEHDTNKLGRITLADKPDMMFTQHAVCREGLRLRPLRLSTDLPPSHRDLGSAEDTHSLQRS